MCKHAIVPEYIRELCSHQLRHHLTELAEAAHATFAYFGFINSDEMVYVPRDLRIPENPYVMQIEWTEGLTGKAMTQGRAYVWNSQQQGEDLPIKMATNLCSEVAVPIYYGGAVAGAIWIDRAADCQTFTDTDKQLCLEAALKCEEEIAQKVKEIESIPDTLRRAAQKCLARTNSRRGYIAVRNADDLLDYYPVGEATRVFLDLSMYEGLCGEVFRTGLPINQGDVHSHPKYIPSGEEIESELIMPIIDHSGPFEGRVIGIINLESSERDAYHDTHVAFVKNQAATLEETVTLLRRSVDRIADSIITTVFEVFHSANQIVFESACESDCVEREIQSRVCSVTSGVLTASTVSWHSDALERVSVDHGDGGVHKISAGDSVKLSCSMLIAGEAVGRLEATWNPASLCDERLHSRILRLVCYYTARFLSNWDLRRRLAQYVEIVDRLAGGVDDGAILSECVQLVPRVLESRHCTIFHVVDAFGKRVLVPGPSSSDGGRYKGVRESYYDVTSQSGLTAWVAFHGRPLWLSNIEDADELQRVSPELRWARRVAEEVDARPRAFLAYPVKDESGDVIGVIRTFRDVSNRRAVFTELDAQMMATISVLVSGALGRAIPCGTRF